MSAIPVTEYSESGKRRLEKRLTIFYQKHSPENLPKVTSAMAAAVDEALIFDRLCLKYGVHPIAEEKEARAANCFPGDVETIVPAVSAENQNGNTNNNFNAIPVCVPPQVARKILDGNATILFAEPVLVVKAPKKEEERILVISSSTAQVFETSVLRPETAELEIRNFAINPTTTEKLIFDDDEPTLLAVVGTKQQQQVGGGGDILYKFSSSSSRLAVQDLLRRLFKASSNAELVCEKMLFLHPSRLKLDNPFPSMNSWRESVMAKTTTSTSNNPSSNAPSSNLQAGAATTTTAANFSSPSSSPSSSVPVAAVVNASPQTPPANTAISSTAQNNLDQLQGEEQRRVRRRIELFYQNHAPQEMQKPGKLDTVMSLDATENKVIRNLCLKYRVPEEMEASQAQRFNLLPPNMNASDVNNAISESNNNNNNWSATSIGTTYNNNNNTSLNATPIRNENYHGSVGQPGNFIYANPTANYSNDNNITINTSPPASNSYNNNNNSYTGNNNNHHLSPNNNNNNNFNANARSPSDLVGPPCTKCRFLEDDNKMLRKKLDGVVEENKILVAQMEQIRNMMMEVANSQGIDIPSKLL